jgi:hypothetical protein
VLKADSGCWDTVVLDIWRDVLVVRVRTGQLGDVGMFKGVIPGDFLASQIDFIAVVSNLADCKVDEFQISRTTFPLKIICPSSLASVEPMVARTKVEC